MPSFYQDRLGTSIGKALKKERCVFLQAGREEEVGGRVVRPNLRSETPFLRCFYTKCIILPRQARDKHKENSKKMAFPIGVEAGERRGGRGEGVGRRGAALPKTPKMPKIDLEHGFKQTQLTEVSCFGFGFAKRFVCCTGAADRREADRNGEAGLAGAVQAAGGPEGNRTVQVRQAPAAGRKRISLLRRFILLQMMITLPRQARDKHIKGKTALKKEWSPRFLAGLAHPPVQGDHRDEHPKIRCEKRLFYI
eukprot:COSAG06_NODE_1087_length_10749_cov_1130.191174_4_plen_251_part_00